MGEFMRLLWDFWLAPAPLRVWLLRLPLYAILVFLIVYGVLGVGR